MALMDSHGEVYLKVWVNWTEMIHMYPMLIYTDVPVCLL